VPTPPVTAFESNGVHPVMQPAGAFKLIRRENEPASSAVVGAATLFVVGPVILRHSSDQKKNVFFFCVL